MSKTQAACDALFEHISTTHSGSLYLISDQQDFSIPPIVTTLWDRPQSAPLLAAWDHPSDRYVFVPAVPPLSKLDAQRQAALALPTPVEYAAFADADVLLGPVDFGDLSMNAFAILTGGPEVVGTFFTHVRDFLLAAEDAPTFVGWGFEDLHILMHLAQTIDPRFVLVNDSWAVAHPLHLRHTAGTLRDAGPEACARHNAALFDARWNSSHKHYDLIHHHARRDDWRYIHDSRSARFNP